MASFTYDITTSLTTLFSTDLNTLATTVRVLSAAFDNSSNLDLFGDVELYIPTLAAAPADGDKIATLWLLPAVDGTNHLTNSTSYDPAGRHLAGIFTAAGVATAQRMAIKGISLPPSLMKFVIQNNDGTSWAATLNTVKIQPYCIKST